MRHSKSLGKIREVSGTQGRTVLLVSHITAAIDAAKDVHGTEGFQGFQTKLFKATSCQVSNGKLALLLALRPEVHRR